MIINKVSLIKYKGKMQVDGVFWEDRLATPLDIYEQYADSLDAASDLDITDGTNVGDINLNTQSLSILGTTNEIDTTINLWKLAPRDKKYTKQHHMQ